jgi:hypothetical protein
MTPSTIGLVTGVVFGFAALVGGFYGFLLVAGLGALGFLLGRVVEGDIDLGGMLGSGRRGR